MATQPVEAPAVGQDTAAVATAPPAGPERALRRVSAALDVIAQVVTSAILVGLLVALFVSIVVRTLRIGAGSVIWIEEVSRFSFMWIGFLGATIAYYRREHIVIDIFTLFLPARVRAALGCLVDLLVLAFLALVVQQGIVLVQETGNQFSQSLNIQIGIIQSVVPLSAAIMILHELAALPAKLRERAAVWAGGSAA